MAGVRAKGMMKMAMRSLYWRLRASLWDMKWLTVMKVRGIEYAARKFDETEIHRCHLQSRTKKATVAKALAMVIISIAIMSMGTFGALVVTRTVSDTGRIIAVGVGVYSDTVCTSAVSTISWGDLNPGGVETYTMYVKNTGTVPVTLSMTTGSWNPSSASSYIGLTWNLQNSTLPAGSVVQAVLVLSVSSSITGVTSFSFNIIITGTQ
jgi:hypothetical protein